MRSITGNATADTELAESERQRQLLMACIHLIRAGHVLPTLSSLYSWAKGADLAMLRYLLTGVLQVCQAPYSAGFAVSFVAVSFSNRMLY